MQLVRSEQLEFAELLARPGVVETLRIGSRFGFLAFHGGNLEQGTEQIATAAADLAGASLYTVTQPEGTRLHLPSAEIGGHPSAALAEFLKHCETVIALHGYGRRGRWTELLFGGRNRDLAAHAARCVADAIPCYRMVTEINEIPRALRGMHPQNPCNLTSGGGIQLELPPRVRGLSPLRAHWPQPIPRAGMFPHARELAEGLAQAAVTMPND